MGNVTLIALCLSIFLIQLCYCEDNDSIKVLEKSCQDRKTCLLETSNQFFLTSSDCGTKLTRLDTKFQFFMELMFYPSIVYNKQRYLISNFPYKNVEDAMTYCAALEGHLAEIEDHNEYKALQNLVLNSPVDFVLIGGSDVAVEGTWVFPGSGLPVKFLDWDHGQPDNFGEEDCLCLWKNRGGKMNDLPCGFRSDDDRFMCEIPRNFYEV